MNNLVIDAQNWINLAEKTDDENMKKVYIDIAKNLMYIYKEKKNEIKSHTSKQM